MLSPLQNIWARLSNTGTSYAQTDRERKEIVLLNRAWMILIAIQSACLISHLSNGLHRSALMTAAFIIGLSSFHLLIKYGRVNAAKITAIAVINLNTVVMAIFFGIQTNLIDFLLLTALLPLYFFEVKNYRLIFWGIAISIIPFAIYHYVAPHLTAYALPLDAQLLVFKSTNWVKVFSLAALLYMIYHKNANYEREVQEKELELTGQKKLYERMLEQIPVDIITFDKELRYSYINSASIKDKNLREWMIGKTNRDFCEDRGIDINIGLNRERMLLQALKSDGPVEFEETVAYPNGRTVHTIKGISPIFSDSKDELICLIGYSLDISDIKNAEEKLKEYAAELERKNEDLHHFVNATSHDLKSPLRNITSYLQIVERKNQGKLDADSMSMIHYAIKSVKHLNQLINDIYHYSVADQKDKPAEITDLGSVLEKILIEMEPVINEKKACIQLSHLPVLKASPSHLGLVFSNLFNNALKYNTSEHPRIKINCEQTEREYIFSIADNGIGIAAEYTRQIFEIFRRLHSSEQYEGTGVGLAICNKIVENYGGRMWVESEAGRGSTFYFSLNRNIVDVESPVQRSIQSFNKFAIAS